MSLKTYINDIWEAVSTTAKGMRITARYGVDVKEEVTIQYPEQHGPVFERFRGFLDGDCRLPFRGQFRIQPDDALVIAAAPANEHGASGKILR